jgi:ATP-dependent helicase HrpB
VNGRGAKLDAAHSFAKEKYLSVAEVTGRAGEGRILLAAKISEQDIESEFASHIEDVNDFAFDEKSASLRARKVRRLGAINLSEKPLSIETGQESAEALAEGIARLGLERLPWSAHQKQLLERVRYLRAQNGDPWPDLSGENMIASVKHWLAPALMQRSALSQVNADDLANALHHLLPHDLMRRLEKDAPTHFTAPTGSNIPIDYAAEQGPTVQLRVQELFGLDQHPKIANGKVPLILALTSPAGRPIQVTRDLPAFWRGSWADVRREMRGRYPKHPWPEDPRTAAPTRRAKPPGT